MLQRKCACGGTGALSGECEECGKQSFTLQRSSRDVNDRGYNNGVPAIVQKVLQSPGQPLDAQTRTFMKPRLGHDFSRIQIHTDALAEESAESVNALAYTVGSHVVFGRGQYAPHTSRGLGLLTHELVHVLQQQGNSQANSSAPDLSIGESAEASEIAPPARPKLAMGHVDDGAEREADRTAEFVMSEPATRETTPLVSLSSAGSEPLLQRETPRSTTPATGPGQAVQATNLRVGVIPVREFIQHVETVERAYPNKSPQEILTLIRSLYYGSPAGSPGFDRLIPDAPNTGAVEVCTDDEGNLCHEPVGVCSCVLAQGLAIDRASLEQAVRRLRERADENAIADNPSPYILVGTELIDVGHLLVGADAVLHPRTSAPFSTHGMPAAPGPASWVGDVGAGMVYLKEHETSGHKSADVVGNPSPTLEDYYRNSAPMTDILGDVDAYVVAQFIGPQTLSTSLRYLYVSESGGTPRYVATRWQEFCSANGLTFTQSGTSINFTLDARQSVITRITAFANLFAGRGSPISAMTVGISPQPWPRAGAFADRFLQDVKTGLEAELARNAARSQQGQTQ